MVFNNSILLGASGQSTGQAPFDTTLIGNSIWLDGSADCLTKSLSSGAAQSRLIISTWVQRNTFSGSSIYAMVSSIGGAQSSNANILQFENDLISVRLENTSGATSSVYKTTAVYRDIGWYHVLLSVDGNVSASMKLYVNGIEQETSITTGSAFTGSLGSFGHSGATTMIGKYNNTESNFYFLPGYLTQTTMIVGQSIQNDDLTVSDFLDTFTFGTNGSQFIPKKNSDIAALATTAGGNSFCLDFANSSDLGNDISGNNNDFTPTSMDSSNQSENTPSKVYPTFNPLTQVGTSKGTFSEGNTKISLASDNGAIVTTPLPSSGMWYWEIDWSSGANGIYPGIALQSALGNTSSSPHTRSDTFVWLAGDSSGRVQDGASGIVSYVGSATSTGRIAVAFDADNTAMYFGTVSGSTITWLASGDPTSGSSKTGAAPFTLPTDETLYIFQSTGNASVSQYLFDEDDWTGSTNRPADALSLNSANLTAPTYQGIDYFDATLYEGNGGVQRVGDFVPFTDAYTVTNSVMFDDGDSRSLSLNPSSSATSSTVAAISLWLKLGNLGTYGRPYTIRVDGNNYFGIAHDSDDKLSFVINNGGATILNRTTTRIFKDKSAWHNLVVIINNVGSVSQADRVKIFYDGVQIPNDGDGFASSGGTCSLDGSSALNFLSDSSAVHDVGGGVFSQHYDGYVAEVVFLDGADSGSKLDATPFGQVDTSTNRWVAKDPGSYTFGNMGYYLEFKVAPGTSNGAGTDTSGRDNHFTSNGSWATSDQFTDCPSQNFDVLGGAQVGGTISEGNTKAALGTGGNQIRSNFNLSSGKWYVESDIQATNNSASIGLVPSRSATFSNGPGRDANGGISYETDGDVFSDNVQNATAEASFAAGDVIQMAIDMDAKKVYFGKNNTFGGNPAAGTGGHFLPASILSDGAALITLGNYSGSQSSTQQINYGQFLNFDGGSTTNGFKFTPPTGFQAVNQDNLDDTASKITAWSWVKNRDVDGDEHILVDRVRGVGEVMHSSDASSENTEPNTVQRFLQRGVQVGNDVQVNTSGEGNVLWQWLLGDSATTGTVIPADNPPSLASTVIAADAGHFSVGTYSGASGVQTVGHGLGAAPDMLIVKGRNVADSWRVFHKDLGNTRILSLNLSNVGASSSIYWNNDGPTSTTFTVATDASVNGAGNNYVFLAFKSIPGVCKVGSYEGNASSDGTYISLGFKPRWIMVKVVDSGVGSDGNWTIYDTARLPFNSTTSNPSLEADTSDKEKSNSHKIDMLSDGVKFRDNSFQTNSARTYIYLAMAEIGGGGTLPPVYSR